MNASRGSVSAYPRAAILIEEGDNLCGPRSSFRGNNFASVKLDQHRGVRLQVFHWDGKSKVVEEKELELQVIEFNKWQTPNLLRVSIFEDLSKGIEV